MYRSILIFPRLAILTHHLIPVQITSDQTVRARIRVEKLAGFAACGDRAAAGEGRRGGWAGGASGWKAGDGPSGEGDDSTIEMSTLIPRGPCPVRHRAHNGGPNKPPVSHSLRSAMAGECLIVIRLDTMGKTGCSYSNVCTSAAIIELPRSAIGSLVTL